MRYFHVLFAVTCCLVLFTPITNAQLIGIGTTSPQSTLDVRASNPATPDNRDGILVPRVNQFPAVNPGAAQNGMLVFLNVAVGNKKPGFYYWEQAALAWKTVGEGKAWSVTGNAEMDTTVNFIGTTDANDLVIKSRNERSGNIGITNTSWGYGSLPKQSGINNTAIGRRSLYYSIGNYNTAVGYNAQYWLYDGESNTSLGVNSLYLSNGSNNSAVGKDAMYSNNAGSNNSAYGFQSLYFNNQGYSNTASGAYSLYNNRSGVNLTAIGDSALFSNFGASLNTGVGSKSLYNTSSGNGNTGIGARSMYTNVAGTNNTGVGANTDVLSNNLSNATAVGNNAKVGCANCLVLGDSVNTKVGIGTGYPTSAKLVINAGSGNNGIDLATSNSYAEMRVIRNTLGTLDHDLYFNFNAATGSAIHLYSEGIGETMKISGQKVAIGTSSPATSAILDVSSISKGFLPPRMSESQRNSIGSPVAGLMVWCNDCGEGQAQIYNGSKWTDLTGGIPQGVVAGEDYAGGTIIYVYQPGDDNYKPNEVHGFIAAKVDQTTTNWGCSGTPVGASSWALGAGKTNTDLILSNCNVGGTAARFCADLVLNGYADWYLPSFNEAMQMLLNGAAVGGLSGEYWTSSESGSTMAHTWNFTSGSSNTAVKTSNLKVRAVRSF